jgi:hypothetical protein
MMADTVTPYLWAILDKVSPFRTICSIYLSSSFRAYILQDMARAQKSAMYKEEKCIALSKDFSNEKQINNK